MPKYKQLLLCIPSDLCCANSGVASYARARQAPVFSEPTAAVVVRVPSTAGPAPLCQLLLKQEATALAEWVKLDFPIAAVLC